MLSQRPFKIDLQISRRRKTRPCSPARHRPKQLLTLTVASKNKPLPEHNPQIHQTKVEISEFQGRQPQPRHNQALHSQRQSEWWTGISQSQDRQAMISQLKKQALKIKFYKDLLEEKQRVHKSQQFHKIQAYEDCLNNLSKLYQQELIQYSRSTILKQQLQRKLSDKSPCNSGKDPLRSLRKNINRDGKKGYNFTPKQVSVFSGASETLLLEDSESSNRREEFFSFGSNLKEGQTRSAPKDKREFLDSGRANAMKKKLEFVQGRNM